MDREAWWATVHGVTKTWTRLSDFTYFCTVYVKERKWTSRFTDHIPWIPSSIHVLPVPVLGHQNIKPSFMRSYQTADGRGPWEKESCYDT